MNIQEMLSKISPEQLQQGMKQLGLSPEQMNKVNNMVNSNNPEKELSKINPDELNAMLKNNPNLAKQLQQANMLSKINEIFKK